MKPAVGTDLVAGSRDLLIPFPGSTDKPALHPCGRGPEQGQIQLTGNEYWEKEFPKLDYLKTARIVE